MLKHAISAIFFIACMAASTGSIAASNQVTEHVNATTGNHETPNTAPSTLIQNSAESFQTDQSNNVTSATTGWMFTFALLGFVLLSNRRGV
jgi:hypothetical protein